MTAALTRRGLAAVAMASLFAAGAALAAQDSPRNLALTARASAFEAYQGMDAGLANDGKFETRWSGIPGHNSGGWFELVWDQPVRIGEVIVFQHDRYVKEMDLQVWDEDRGSWVTLQHLGHPDSRLPKVVVCRTAPRLVRRLRLANITNGPSFTEVQIFEDPLSHPPVVNLASDANGGLIGMVSDPWGSAPVAGAAVSLSGTAKPGPWKASARSDDYGLFFVPMPLGLTGEVAVAVRLPMDAASGVTPTPTGVVCRVDAATLRYGLTPADLHRRSLTLDGAWRFAPDPPPGFWEPAFDDRAWAEIKVPGHFAMQGFQSVDGVGGYRKHFKGPSTRGRLKLRFEGVYSGAEVWLNGQRLAYHEGGALPFEIDITEAVAARDNLLAVRVTEHTVVSDRFDKMSEYADFPLAGIMRSVHVFEVPAAHVGGLALSTVFDESYRDARIVGRVAVLNESPKPLSQAALEFRLTDPDGRSVPLRERPVPASAGPWQRVEADFSLAVTAPRHWEAEHPHRYTLEVLLKKAGREVHRLVQRIGFRQTEVRRGELWINGRPVKIRGTCHHDSHPLLGRAVTEALTRQDLELMKDANLNSLRTSHYPPVPALLDIADEVGLYVEDEGSFCWVAAADDLRLTPRLMQLNAELLARDRNHPSVFVWSLCNESAFGYGFERSRQWMRAADPSRPNAGSYDRGSLDLLARHNPITIADIGQLERAGKPVLWDESWCIFQGIWGDVAELWLDPGLRDHYAAPLPAIYARMMRSRAIAGSQIWAWSDDIFCVPNRGLEYGRGTTPCHFIESQYRLPGRGLVGDAPWGVVDGWRRPKPEFWITKKLHSPVKIRDAPVPVPEAGQAIRIPVENQYDFTDLGELSLNWRIGADGGLARMSLAPRSIGEIEVRPTRMPQAGQILALEVKDRQGRLVDACKLPLGQAVFRLPELTEPRPLPLRIVPEQYLAGPGTRVVGQDFELAFDHNSGGLRRAVVFGQALLLELPRIHLLPAASPLSPLPNPLSWRCRKLEVTAEGDSVRILSEGAYDRFEGVYDLLVSPTGALAVKARFKNVGDKLRVRECGLAFSVPTECDLLRWARQGEWSVYPDDHIGRPAGQTRAFAPHAQTLPPTWPWAQDHSPMGCNDFRSAKRRIHWASIGYPEGPGVWIESDGSKHARAMVAADRIVFHLNDWYGGTHAGLWEWTSNYGEGKAIAPGEIIESSAVLRLARLAASAAVKVREGVRGK